MGKAKRMAASTGIRRSIISDVQIVGLNGATVAGNGPVRQLVFLGLDIRQVRALF
jgi:hypothetical protein